MNQGQFIMPAENVSFVGSWMADTDTAYTVEYYQKAVGETAYTLKEAETLAGTTDTDATYAPKTYQEYTYEASKTTWESTEGVASTTKLTIAGDGSLIIRLYYEEADTPEDPGTPEEPGTPGGPSDPATPGSEPGEEPGGSLGSETAQGTNAKNAVKTGDSATITMWMALAALASVTIVVSMTYRRKAQRQIAK